MRRSRVRFSQAALFALVRGILAGPGRNLGGGWQPNWQPMNPGVVARRPGSAPCTRSVGRRRRPRQARPGRRRSVCGRPDEKGRDPVNGGRSAAPRFGLPGGPPGPAHGPRLGLIQPMLHGTPPRLVRTTPAFDGVPPARRPRVRIAEVARLGERLDRAHGMVRHGLVEPRLPGRAEERDQLDLFVAAQGSPPSSGGGSSCDAHTSAPRGVRRAPQKKWRRPATG
jgi:hypothetical protein